MLCCFPVPDSQAQETGYRSVLKGKGCWASCPCPVIPWSSDPLNVALSPPVCPLSMSDWSQAPPRGWESLWQMLCRLVCLGTGCLCSQAAANEPQASNCSAARFSLRSLPLEAMGLTRPESPLLALWSWRHLKLFLALVARLLWASCHAGGLPQRRGGTAGLGRVRGGDTVL